MANTIFKGDAMAVAKVCTATPGGTIESGDVFILTCAGEAVSFAATATTVANVCTGLAAAWNLSTVTEHTEITASDDTTTITLTGNTAGVDFTITATTTETGGGAADAQTFTLAIATEVQGPNVWCADNFTEGTVPGASDVVIFEDSDVDCLYLIDQNAVTVGSLIIKQSYTGSIGLPFYNNTGTKYWEYRERYLKISATTVTIGDQDANGDAVGSGRIQLNVGSAACTCTVHDTGDSSTDGVGAFIFVGTNAANILNVNRGEVSVAPWGGETAVLATLRVGYVDSLESDANVTCGSGTTLTIVTKNGGVLEINSAVTTVTQTGGGKLAIRGAATCTTLNAEDGTTFYDSTGTCTTAIVGGGATLDFRRVQGARTVTNASIYEGGTIHDPAKSVTWTNGIDLQHTRVDDVSLDIGTHLTLTTSAI